MPRASPPGDDGAAGALAGVTARGERLRRDSTPTDLQGLAGRGRVAEAEDVLPLQVERVHAERPAIAVHVPLDRPDRSARRSCGRPFGGVFVATASASTETSSQRVGAGVEGAAGEDDGAEGGRRRRRRRRRSRTVSVPSRSQPLAISTREGCRLSRPRRPPPAVDDLHRPPRLLREEEGVEGDDGREALAAEGCRRRRASRRRKSASRPKTPLILFDVVGAPGLPTTCAPALS